MPNSIIINPRENTDDLKGLRFPCSSEFKKKLISGELYKFDLTVGFLFLLSFSIVLHSLKSII